MTRTTKNNVSSEKDEPTFTRDSEFLFLCHPEVSCFTDCCFDVTIFLTPHDVLKLKNSLKLKSWEFLTSFSKVFYRENNPFPFVQLKMEGNEGKPCPFVNDKGCSVYGDRPWSCRMYPLDLVDQEHYTTIVDANKCKGLLEKREWLVSEWLQNQGVPSFDEYDYLYSQLIANVLGKQQSLDNPQIREMVYMAAYDIDRFRKFVFESSFLKMFDLPEEQVDLIKTDDLELLKLGFRWLSMGLINPMSLRVRTEVIDDVLEKKKPSPPADSK